MPEYLVRFVEWTKLKIRLHIDHQKIVYFYEREIWWASLGENIGFEQNGKDESFSRPVLILKKLGKYSFLGIPLSTKIKERIGYLKLYFKGEIVSAIISQMRIYSTKRILRKMGRIDNNQFDRIKGDIWKMYFCPPNITKGVKGY